MSAEVVFIGRVSRVQTFPRRQAHTIVLESFRGVHDREVDIVTSATDCGINFKAHKEYLIYAWRNKDSGRLETGACSHTALVEQSAENIQNLRELTSGQGPARVFGFATADPPDVEVPFRASLPLAGVRILLRSGDQSWQTVTDDHGNYEFTNLPAGLFEESAELPNSAADHRRRQFRLVPSACSRQIFLGVPVARIAGRLLDSQNHPVPNVLVEIEGVPPTHQPHPYLRDLTDEEGRFYYDDLEMGKYVLGLNLTTPPFAHDWYGKRVPFAKSYYPGVANRSQAEIVTLRDSRNVQDLEFRLPPVPNPLIVRGKVALSNGSPVQALVTLLDLEYPGAMAQVDTVRSNRDGSFSIQGIEGRPYGILAQTRCDGHICHSGVVEIREPAGAGLRLVLSQDDPSGTSEVLSRFKIWQSPLW